MRRQRNAKIIATLGPASSSREQIRALYEAGADVFRLNFSHGTHDEQLARFQAIRQLELEAQSPIGVLMDLQGPKLRIGNFADGSVQLEPGQEFRLDTDGRVGDATRVAMPHPEIYQALVPDAELLLDDGRIRLQVTRFGADFAETRVVVGGTLSDHKGVNVPGVPLPIAALTDKDREDLEFGLELGVDWVALSFVQRAEDIAEVKERVAGRAGVLAKLEKPAAIDDLDRIVEESDAVMVARGDLGVELPPEDVPRIQKRIVRACRRAGKPVVVATQMLESMVHAPTPTRAETTDVATAIYDGVDAVMLSAESAVGAYPKAAVAMMDRIIRRTEEDPHYRELIDSVDLQPTHDVSGAICAAMNSAASVIPLAATVTYTESGATARHAARERPQSPILSITPHIGTARRLKLVWGVYPVSAEAAGNVQVMVAMARDLAVREGLAEENDHVLVIAGLPFGKSGSTNMIRIARIGPNAP